MTKISTTQQKILNAAADRSDGAIHPLPANIKGGAEKKVISSLKSKGLAAHPDGDENLPLLITDAGRAAIGLEPLPQKPADDTLEADVAEAEKNLGIAATENDPETPTETDDTPQEPVSQPKGTTPADAGIRAAQSETPEPDEKKAPKEPRPGTKKARIWEMLRRDDGATTQQIMDETEWSNHTVRGFIALAKKAGWNITTHKHRMVGPNQTGAKGSFTRYFLAEAS